MKRIVYPETHRDETAFTIGPNNVKIPDPYRWLEDPNSAETQAWVESQNTITNKFLEEIPFREKIKQRMTELYDYPKWQCPFKVGNAYYFFKNDGLQNQDVLYTQTSLDAQPTVFVDPNKFSEDGTVSLSNFAFSESGKYFAYALSVSGSDWRTIKIREVETNKDFEETLEWVKFSSIAWTHDDKGFFYCQYEAPKDVLTARNDNQRVYYHFIGTPQSQDILIYQNPNEPTWLWGPGVTDDGRYLYISVSRDCAPVNLFYYTDLTKIDLANYKSIIHFVLNSSQTYSRNISVTKLIDEWEAEFSYITNFETTFYFKTNFNAPKYKLIAIDITNPEKKNWREIIPESKRDVLDSIDIVNNNIFIVVWIRDVVNVVQLYNLEGELLEEVKLPTLGAIRSLTTKKQHTEFFYQFTSFLNPSIIFRYDFTVPHPDKRITVWKEVTVKDFNPDEYQTEQVWVTSRDGTKFPMFLVYSRTLQRDGNNPVFLYGYGGFNISMTPYFSAIRIVLLKHFRCVFALPNIRGGGEYGEEWHQAGIKSKKQNVFDDFCAAAEWLINNNFTKPEKICINGGSNGGLLVCACVNQRPELFGCAIAQVPVLDMLRFHLFTIGYAWTSDYGCPDDPKDFEYLLKYSPVHNIPKGKKFPALLLCTADHDDRVAPLHSYKYIATVQNTLGKEEFQTNPLLIRIDTKAGHGAGKPTDKIIKEYADMYAFFAYTTNIQWMD